MRSNRSTATEAQLARFPMRSEIVEGRRQSVHVISCCNCPNEATSNCGSGSGAIGPEMLNRRFTRQGWYVGRTASAHICPDCNIPRQRAAPEPVEETKPVKEKPFSSALTADTITADKFGPSKIVGTVSSDSVKEGTLVPNLAPKRELSFADRRIINAKLEEVYENELVGYRKDHSDTSVAKDLGVIEAWVAEVRAANFGPAAGNEAAQQLRTEIADLRSQHAEWVKVGESIARQLASVSDRLAALGS